MFDNFSVNVIRLKIPIPSSIGSDSVGGQRFVTRMKDTDFFQAMSMYPLTISVANCRFEAAFPFAGDKEKEAEKAHIEKHYSVVQDPKVKGLWVTSDVALQLAKDYGLEEYISAMKDASPNKPSESLTLTLSDGKSTTTSPKESPTTPSLQPPRRTRRSVSPKKRGPKATAPKAPSSTSGRGRKKRGSTVDEESVASSLSPVVSHVTPGKPEEAVEKVVEEDKPILDAIKIAVPPSFSPHPRKPQFTPLFQVR